MQNMTCLQIAANVRSVALSSVKTFMTGQRIVKGVQNVAKHVKTSTPGRETVKNVRNAVRYAATCINIRMVSARHAVMELSMMRPTD